MSFFKEFKDDFSQAVNEMVPGEEEKLTENLEEQQGEDELVVNTLESELDMKSEIEKLNGLLQEVSEKANPSSEKVVENTMKMEEIQFDEEKEDSKETEKRENVEEITMSTETSVAEEKAEDITSTFMSETSGEREEATDENAIITEGMTITGNLESTGSVEVKGAIRGDVKCNGKLVVTGNIVGNSKAAEFFADAAKIEGEIETGGTVKIGYGSVVVGNISASSAVIAGAIKGDIDVDGPVVVDTSAVIMGNIKSRSVQINNGAVIEGFCSQSYAEVDVQSLFGNVEVNN